MDILRFIISTQPATGRLAHVKTVIETQSVTVTLRRKNINALANQGSSEKRKKNHVSQEELAISSLSFFIFYFFILYAASRLSIVVSLPRANVFLLP